MQHYYGLMWQLTHETAEIHTILYGMVQQRLPLRYTQLDIQIRYFNWYDAFYETHTWDLMKLANGSLVKRKRRITIISTLRICEYCKNWNVLQRCTSILKTTTAYRNCCTNSSATDQYYEMYQSMQHGYCFYGGIVSIYNRGTSVKAWVVDIPH